MKFFAVAVFFISFLFASTAYASEIFQEAQKIFKTMQTTHYEHQTVIDESKGVYIVDCSAFVCYILKKVSPLAHSSLPVDKNHTHARAKNFYDYFKSLQSGTASNSHWMAILTIKELERGDIVSWKYDPSLQKKDTGHVVIVHEKPVLEAGNLYRVRIIDASKGKHANDSRGKEADGIGIGEMWFRVDEKNAPIGLHWSSKEKRESNHPIAMARAINIP